MNTSISQNYNKSVVTDESQAVAAQNSIAISKPAGPWRRLGAMIMDSLLVSLVMLPFIWIAATQKSISLFSGDFSENVDLLIEQSPGIMYLLLVIYLAYTVVLTVKKGGTPGKFYFYNFNVVNFKTQQRIGYGRALAREASKILYNIPILGALIFITSVGLVLLRNDRRSVHDFIAGTQVVKVSE